MFRNRKPPSAAKAQTAITRRAAERRAAEEAQVDQRLVAARLVGAAAPTSAATATRTATISADASRAAALDDRVGQRASSDDHQHLADRVERRAVRRPRLRHEARGQRDRRQADGDVDPEDRAPADASTSTPPSTGPSAMLIPTTAPHTPIAWARSRGSSKVLRMIDIATGLSIEPPTACSTGRRSASRRDGASAAEQRAEREDRQPDLEDPHAAEPVGGRARRASAGCASTSV